MPKNPQCRLCPLSTEARIKSVCVWGRQFGPESSRPVMVVGEAPGQMEDRQDSPFVGPSGRLIQEALKDAGVNSYYITNCAKCWPKLTKNPKPPHIKACSDYLEEEIAAVKPQFIIAVGAVSLHRIAGKGKITEMSGKEFHSERYNCTVFPIVHPANLLRGNMAKLPQWKADIMRFGRMVRGELLTEPPVKVEVCEYHAEFAAIPAMLEDHVKAGHPLSFDFEDSYGVPWWHKDFQAYTIAFGLSKSHALVVPLQHPESPFKEHVPWLFKHLRPIFERKWGGILTAHYMAHDNMVVQRLGGYLPNTNWDTMVAWQCIDENMSKGLKNLGRTVIGWPDWGIDTTDLANVPLKDVARYNGYDAAASLAILEEEEKRFAQMPRVREYFLALPQRGASAADVLCRNGMYVDVDKARRHARYALKRAQELASHMPVENPNSSQQIGKWFFSPKSQGGLGLPVLKLTPTGQPCTDDDVVKRLSKRVPAVREVSEVRNSIKNCSTYFKPTIERVENSIDQLEHFEYNVAGSDTGRWSSGLHTRPRDGFVRNIYTAPPGWTLLAADMSQIEARLAAWAAAGMPQSWDKVNHKSMLWAWYEGRDVYIEQAAEGLGLDPVELRTRYKAGDPEAKQHRQIMGKVPVLACLYDISAKGLQDYGWREYEIEWSLEEATTLWRAFRRRWPEFPRWHHREMSAIKSRGWSRSVLGRVRRLPDAMSSDDKIASDAARTGLNMPIQGLASDIVENSLILMTDKEKELEAKGEVRYKTCAFHHDALLFRVKNEYREWLGRVVENVMTKSYLLLEPLGLHLPPDLLKVELEWGPWGVPWKEPAA
jgi:uracil-DNA glycosylase family 4